jgi:hypothetical protein
MKWLLIILILIPLGLACKESYFAGEDVILSDVIVDEGYGADCNVSIYQMGVFNASGIMVRDDLAYTYNASIMGRGVYEAVFRCNESNFTYYGECVFNVGEGTGGGDMLGFIILIPILIATLLIVVAALLSPDHNVIKWGMMMVALFFTIVSVNWGATSIAYLFGMSELVGQLGEFTFQFGMVMFFILAYFTIWLIVKLFDNMVAKKQEKLRY